MDLPKYDLPEPELVIEFDPPLKISNLECAQLTLREPTGAEVRAAEGHLRKGVTAETVRMYQMALIKAVSGSSQQVIDLMPISKINEAAEYLQGFVTPSQTTGNS